jgi:hypothetical protein
MLMLPVGGLVLARRSVEGSCEIEVERAVALLTLNNTGSISPPVRALGTGD